MINDEKKVLIEQNNSKISLSNSENYYNNFSLTINNILLQQLNILEDYIKNMNEKFNKNNFYIIIKGYETIFHIYQKILYYTNNNNLAYYYANKSIYLYKEYTSQIMDESNTFLKLTNRDAILYIYRNTIFKINPELVKKNKTNNPKEIFDILFLHNNIIKLLLSLLYKNYNENIYFIYFKLINNRISYQLNYSNYCNLSFFVNFLYDNFLDSYTVEEIMECIEKFCKKINKQTITREELNQKLNNNCKQLNPTQLISKLFIPLKI